MSTLTLDMKPQVLSGKITVEFDAVEFERLAATLKLYNPDFVASVDRAEQEIRRGKARRLRSLSALTA